jgi:hypothetical protein
LKVKENTVRGKAIAASGAKKSLFLLENRLFQFLETYSEAPRPQGGPSRARSGEQDASQGNFVHIVPLDPAHRAGLAGHVPVSLRGAKETDCY